MTKARTISDSLNLPPRKNYIINGNFDIWQRGTSFNTNTYTADRWTHDGFPATIPTYSRQAFTPGQTDVPNEPTYFMRAQHTTSNANPLDLRYFVEDVRTLAGRPATFSFYAKSSVAKTLTFTLQQVFGAGGSTTVAVSTSPSSVNLTTSWQKFTITATVPSIAGKTIGTNPSLYFKVNTDTTIHSFDIAQVQLEEGSVATNFEQRSLGEELTLCQRYYQILNRIILGGGATPAINRAYYGTYQLRPIMRAIPTATITNTITQTNITTLTFNEVFQDCVRVSASSTVNNDCVWLGNVSCDAEL